MDLNIIENAIPLGCQKIVKEIAENKGLEWFYTDQTISVDYNFNKHQFTHMLYKDDTGPCSDVYDKIMEFFQFPEFKTHSLVRAQFNLNTPYKRKYIDDIIHVDAYDSDHVSYLYYVHDTDGPTTFYDSNVVIVNINQGDGIKELFIPSKEEWLNSPLILNIAPMYLLNMKEELFLM